MFVCWERVNEFDLRFREKWDEDRSFQTPRSLLGRRVGEIAVALKVRPPRMVVVCVNCKRDGELAVSCELIVEREGVPDM